MITFETLLPYAQRASQFPHNENARSNLLLRLQLCTDTDILRQLASRFPFHPEVAVPAWRRIGALGEMNATVLIEAAGALYSLGADEDSRELVERALEIHETFVPAWELKAALCEDPVKRRAIYEQILKIEPGNRAAVDNLIMLGRPKH